VAVEAADGNYATAGDKWIWFLITSAMKDHSNSVDRPPRRGDPQIPVNGANQLVAKFSRLYAEADPEDQFALRIWMRDIILGRNERRVNIFHARRIEKRMVEACERRILEFPVDMHAREVAKELKREGWYAWATDYQSIILRIERVRAKAGN
jgi:hypothetical protein